MMRTVVVVVNITKPFIYASPRKGNHDGAFISGFFIAYSTTVLRTSARLQPEGAEEKGTRYVARLGGSSRITRATGRITKSRGASTLDGIVIHASGVRTFPSYPFNGVGGSLGEMSLYS